jgi:hypothetical protein
MKKLKIAVSGLCLIALLTFAVPTVVLASDGPQGGSNSTTAPPPPPPKPDSKVLALIELLLRLIG